MFFYEVPGTALRHARVACLQAKEGRRAEPWNIILVHIYRRGRVVLTMEAALASKLWEEGPVAVEDLHQLAAGR